MPIKGSVPRILVVDDEPRMCESTRKLLDVSGYQTATCHSGKEAIEHIAQDPVDVVVFGYGYAGWYEGTVWKNKENIRKKRQVNTIIPRRGSVLFT